VGQDVPTMKPSMHRALAAMSLALMAACGAVVTPAPRDADVTDVIAPQDVLRVDSAAGCVFADGTRCALGQTCPTPDGCNTCQCAAGGQLQCTLRACFDAGAAVDAGCVGGSLGRGGGYCAGPDDGPLPVECCRGWSCDSRQALCDRIPPTCPAGWTATVAGTCYGPCVPAANCAPMRCLSGVGCPLGWRCDDADNCVFAPR
jgi:hypothetical protein